MCLFDKHYGCSLDFAAWSACATNASSQPREPTRTFDCIIEPSLRLKISTPVAGVLRDVMVDRGDVIRKGDTLAVLESAVEEANVAVSAVRAQNNSTVKGRQSRLEFLERKRSRISQLQSRGSATDVSLDEAETDTRVARNELQEAEFALRLAVPGAQPCCGAVATTVDQKSDRRARC